MEKKEILSIFDSYGAIEHCHVLPNQINTNQSVCTILLCFNENKSVTNVIENFQSKTFVNTIEPLNIKFLSEFEENNDNNVVPTKLPDPIDPGQFIYQQGYFIPYSNYSTNIYNTNNNNYVINNQQPTIINPIQTTNIIHTNEINYPTLTSTPYPIYQHLQQPQQQVIMTPNSPTAGTYTASVPLHNPPFIQQPQSEYFVSPEGRLYVRSAR